jgi:hypothetical protein
MIDDGTNPQNAPLSKLERRKFAACERTIKEGLKPFLAVGRALLCIRDGRLYRERYVTFDEYCEQRWNLRKTRAYQLMDAAQPTFRTSPSDFSEFNLSPISLTGSRGRSSPRTGL